MFYVSKTSGAKEIAEITDTQDAVVEVVTHKFLYKYCKANAVLGVALNPDSVQRVTNDEVYNLDSFGMRMSANDLKLTVNNHKLTRVKSSQAITALTVPYGVTGIGQQLMYTLQRNAITVISFPCTLKSIDNSAFYNMPNLQKVVIPSSVEYIGDNAFAKCPKLEVEFEDADKIIFGASAFDDRHCEIDDNVYYLGKTAMGIVDKTATHIKIREGTVRLAPTCFYKCRKVTTVDLPNTLVDIGYSCFQGASKLKEIKIPTSVKRLGKACFAECLSLTEVFIPDSVKVMGSDTFRNCKRLREVRLSPNVKSVSCYFNKCSVLTKIEVPEGVETVETYAGIVQECPELVQIVFPSTLKNVGNYVIRNCAKLQTIIFKGKTLDCSASCTFALYPETFDSVVTVYLPVGAQYVNNLVFQKRLPRRWEKISVRVRRLK